MLGLTKILLLLVLLLLSVHAGISQSNFWEPVGGPKSAHVTVLVIKSPDTVFAGTTRGVLRSTDAGESWHEAGLVGVYIGDIKLAPGGEVFAAATNNEQNTVYRSLDNGTSWEVAGDGLGVGQGGGCLAIAPDGTLYAGSVYWQGGVYRSTDSGSHWVRISDFIMNTLAVNDSGHIFLGGKILGHSSTEDHIFRSTDKGATWVDLATYTSGNFCIVINNRGHIFCGRGNGIFRSTDNGVSWESAGSELDGRQIWGLAGSGGDTLFASTSGGCGLARSTDNGKSWATTNLEHKVWALAAGADGQVFAGGTSLFRSASGGESWSPVNVGWSDLEIKSLACGRGDTVYANAMGYKTDRGFFRSTDSGISWTELPIDAYFDVLRVSPNGSLFGSNTSAPIAPWSYRSTDGGAHWTPYPLDFGFWNPVFNDNGHIFALGNGVIRSTDNGDTWTTVSSGLGNRNISSLAISGGGVVFAGADTGRVFRSANNGASWDPVGIGLASSTSSVVRLATGAEGEIFAEVVIDLTEARVYHSTTSGADWTFLYSLLRQSSDMVVDASGNLFVSFYGDPPTDPVGVYRNGVPINSGLADSSVFCLALDSHGYLFAGTRGGLFRSAKSTITAVDESSPNSLPATIVLEQNYPNPFNPRTVIRSQTPEASHVRIVIFDLLGRELKVLVNEKRAAGYYEDAFDASGLASGVYVYRMTAGSFVTSRRMLLIK